MEAILLLQGQKFSIFYIKGTRSDVVDMAEAMGEANHKQMLQLLNFVAELGPPRNEEKYRKVKSQEGLFELKPGGWRVPFFYHPYQQGQIVLTHAFKKEGANAQTSEFEYAAKVRDEFLATLTVDEDTDAAKTGKQKDLKQASDKSGRKGKPR